MRVRLYVTPGSAPSMTARLMLEHKGIDYRRRDLVHPTHRVLLRLLRFDGGTVPALRIDGRRVQGSRAIARALDEIRPVPPLRPEEEIARRAVDEAERWGDESLQPVPRRLAFWGSARDRASAAAFLEGARIGIPIWLAARTSAPVVALSRRVTGADDDAAQRDLVALPELMDHVDDLVARGVVGGAEPNAADFQIATSVRLLMTFDQLRPWLEQRPAGRLAMRIVPHYPGRIGPVIPAGWLPARPGPAAPVASTAR